MTVNACACHEKTCSACARVGSREFLRTFGEPHLHLCANRVACHARHAAAGKRGLYCPFC